MKAEKRAPFIVIDGPDGAGKSTVIERIKKELEVPVTYTREPGGSPSAEKIRERILSEEGSKLGPVEIFNLFWEARMLHLKETIVPNVTRGRLVITDRFDSSSFAYQVRGEEQNELFGTFLVRRGQCCLELCEPDCYIFLDVPLDVARERMRTRVEKLTHFDARDADFHKRVREGFQEFSGMAVNVVTIDARQSIERVTNAVLGIIAANMQTYKVM